MSKLPDKALDQFMKREAAQRPGAYVLHGPRSGEAYRDTVYIGEGDPVGPRLKAHVGQKDFWTEAVVFTSKDYYLTKTQIQFLEASLISETQATARADLDNVNTPAAPNISEADRAEVEGFLAHVKLLLGVSGYDFLEPWEGETEKPTRAREKVFHFCPRLAKARMVRSASGYVVLAGSTAVAQCTKSSGAWVKYLRKQPTQAGVLLQSSDRRILEFRKDASFKSPSTAAAVVYGGNKNGWLLWKLEDGRTLREVESTEGG